MKTVVWSTELDKAIRSAKRGVNEGGIKEAHLTSLEKKEMDQVFRSSHNYASVYTTWM